MKKVRGIFILFIGLLASTTVFAVQNNPIVCPVNITCNYDTGLCDLPLGWVLDTGNAQEPFSGSQMMNLLKIWAYKTFDINQSYQFECVYRYGNHSSISTYIYVKNLEGANWVFSGFGKQRADCSNSLNPSMCMGEN